MTSVIDRARAEIKLGEYAVAHSGILGDPTLLPRVQEYRRRTGTLMKPLSQEDIRQKTPAAEYHVSRKIDGEFTVLIFQDGEAFTLNPGGVVRLGLPWETEAAKLLLAAGVQEAQIAGELYVDVKDRRARVHDVTSLARQPDSDEDLEKLRFAAFDVVSLNGEPSDSFAQSWSEIERIFGDGTLAHPVEAKLANNVDEIESLFESWVGKEGAEGIVVRSDTAGLFKIKPKHTVEAVVIGFAESEGEREGLLHDLLLGTVREDGTIQILTRVGGGFSTEQRREMLCDLKDIVVESEFAEVNSDSVAYQMVKPEWVVEISCLDVISENTRGGPINRMALEFDGKYKVIRPLPLVSVISPQFIRRREDKNAVFDDAGITQITRIVDVPMSDRSAKQLTLPHSEIIQREVFTKTAKGETMVRKFVAWKTNKETISDDYPAFVLHYTDFSPNRKDPLARDVRVSNSLEQILKLYEAFKEKNIKKGWELASGSEIEAKTVTASDEPVTAPETTVAESPAAETIIDVPKKKTTKKKAAPKKKTAKKSTKVAAETAPKKKTPAKAKAKTATKKTTKKKSK